MKACESYIDLMMRSIDREITPQEEAELQAHLAQCEACRALFETYRALDMGLSAAEEKPPETLTGAVMNSIRAEQRQNSPKHLLRRFRFTAVAAAAAVLVLVFARFQADVTSVPGENISAARSAGAAVPQVEAELQAAPEAPAAREAALAEAPEPEMEEAVEEAAAEECYPEAVETPMEPAEDDADTVTMYDNGEMDLSRQAEALHALGYSGDVLLVSGITDEELQMLFPGAAVISLETGRAAYEVTVAEADTAAAAGEIIIDQTYSDESAGEYCYLFLRD